MSRRRDDILICLLVAFSIYIAFAFAAWEWRHAHCNRGQTWRHLGDVLTFNITEGCR